MKRALAAVLLWLPGLSVGADGALVLTLEDILARALKDNIDVESAELDLSKLHSRYAEALGSALPSVDVAGNAVRYYKPPVAFMNGTGVQTMKTNYADASLSAQQPLYTGGKVGNAVRLAKDAFRGQSETVRAARDEALFTARRLYDAVLLGDLVREIQGENLDRARDHLATVRERYDQGIDSDLALQRQHVEEAEARSLLRSADVLRESALLALKNFLRLDLDQPVEVRGSFADPSPAVPDVGALEKTALARRPEVSAARAAVAVQEDLRRLARAEFQPALFAFGTYDHFAQSEKTDFARKDQAESLSAGLGLRWNIFRGGQDVQRARQARLDGDKARLAAEKVERGVRLEIREKWLALGEAVERASVEREAAGHARLALRAVEARYQAGESSQLELNDAALAFNRARLAEARALDDYWTGRAALRRAVGVPLEEVTP